MIAPHHFSQLRGKPLLEREEEEAGEEGVSIGYSHVLGKEGGIAVKKREERYVSFRGMVSSEEEVKYPCTSLVPRPSPAPVLKPGKI